LPVIPGGEPVGEGPEPQRTPGVHDPAQPPVGAAGVSERRLDLMALHPATDGQVLGAPDIDGAPDLLLRDLQAAEGDLPEAFDAGGQAHRPIVLLLGGLAAHIPFQARSPVAAARAQSLALLGVVGRAPARAGSRKWWMPPFKPLARGSCSAS